MSALPSSTKRDSEDLAAQPVDRGGGSQATRPPVKFFFSHSSTQRLRYFFESMRLKITSMDLDFTSNTVMVNSGEIYYNLLSLVDKEWSNDG